MLIDEVKVKFIAGKGGDGLVSFRREKFVPKGGPDGGNGGKGGDVYVKGVNNIRVLRKFRESPIIEGTPGEPGGKNKRSGKNSADTVISVPLGTKITNLTAGGVFEILSLDEIKRLAKGGKGGRGNWEFRSSTNQTPREFEKGVKGEVFEYLFELQMIADVGLIGLPNAGKSTLLNTLTHAHAQVANYPFTTLEPNLGTFGPYIIADIPGLIEGASTGKGLGSRFLRHVERTRLLVHCISCESTNPQKDYKIIKQELESHNPEILKRPELIIFTKYDVLSEKELKAFKTKAKKVTPNPLFVSVIDDESIKVLNQKLLNVLSR
jgi:GTPase